MRAVALVALIVLAPSIALAQRDRPFLDTLGRGLRFKGRSFDLTKPLVRDSLRTVIARHRDAWHATGIRDYRLVVQSSCFCPGPVGWMLLDVKDGKVARATSAKGKKLPIGDNDYSIDRLFEYLEMSAGRDDGVEVAFDSARHFPAYIRTDFRHGLPDDWWILDVRSLVVTKAARPR
jgi:hypothetical protein